MSQNVKWCFCPPEESTDTQESNDYDVQLSSHSIVRKWSELPESITIPRGQVSMTSLPPPPSNNWHKEYLSFGTPPRTLSGDSSFLTPLHTEMSSDSYEKGSDVEEIDPVDCRPSPSMARNRPPDFILVPLAPFLQRNVSNADSCRYEVVKFDGFDCREYAPDPRLK